MKSLLFKAQKRTFHRLLWPLAVMDVSHGLKIGIGFMQFQDQPGGYGKRIDTRHWGLPRSRQCRKCVESPPNRNNPVDGPFITPSMLVGRIPMGMKMIVRM